MSHGSGCEIQYAEANWKRVVELPVIDDVWLADRLSDWPELLSSPWSVLGGGLRSLNVRVGEMVARLAMTDGDFGVLEKEAAAIELVKNVVPVPEIIDVRPGAF